MTDKAYAVPLHEQLASVPRNARLIIDDPDGKGTRFIPIGRYCHEASEALRARLAQPEPEPVAWRFYDGGMWCYVDHLTDLPQDKFEPLYTAPPQREWQGLTDEEIDQVAWPHFIGNIMPSVKIIVRQLEAKLKEKNA